MKKIIFSLILFILVAGCTKEVFQVPLNEPAPSAEQVQTLQIGAENNQKTPSEPPASEVEKLVEGKTPIQRFFIIKANLHTPSSGDEARNLFPDFVQVYVEHNPNPYFSGVVPFTYYYSQEADITVSICNIKYTVFICQGKIDRLIQESDYGKCLIADAYFQPEKYSTEGKK